MYEFSDGNKVVLLIDVIFNIENNVKLTIQPGTIGNVVVSGYDSCIVDWKINSHLTITDRVKSKNMRHYSPTIDE